MTTEPLSPHAVPPTGGTTGEITVTSPAAGGFTGDYTFVLISGSDYAEVTPDASSDGKFSVGFYPNNSAVSR